MREIPCPQCGEPMRQAKADEVVGGVETLDRYDVRLCERNHDDGLLGFIGFYSKAGA